MRILFVSASPLKKEISIGNTFLNLFEDAEGVMLASICTRAGSPEPPVSACMCVSEKMLIENLFRKTPVGRTVEVKENRETITQFQNSSVLKFVKKHRWTAFFWLQELIWKLGHWRSPELVKFISDFQPDVIFTIFSDSVYLHKLILFSKSVSRAKLVLYAWDDYYTMKRFMLSPLRWIKHFIDRASMRELAEKADLFYVISEIQKKDYEICLHKACKVLTKGADFTASPDIKDKYNTPIQLVFTGNIGLNRWKSLKMIADVLENVNKDGIRAQLRIYTATPLTKKMEKALARGESSFLMGGVSASEIPGIQKNADMLVHVEAFDVANRLRVRQSFSTKIVDYLKAARPILAVGPKNVASIDHLLRNDCAIVADNKAELAQKLGHALEHLSELSEIVEKAYECGRKYHNKQDIQAMLMQDLLEICGE